MQPSVTIRWLGQAGFEITAPSGAKCLVDAYLSDFLNEDRGYERTYPPVIEPEQATADLLVATHSHEDHMDLPIWTGIAGRQQAARFAGPETVRDKLLANGVSPERVTTLVRNTTAQLGEFRVHAGFARHEQDGRFSVPDALSVIIEVAGVTFFVSGDSQYDRRLLWPSDLKIDVGAFAINGGRGGNMNVYEAALLAYQLKPTIAIPMHYGLWDAHRYGEGATLDPDVFAETLRRLGGPSTSIMTVGETLDVPARTTDAQDQVAERAG